MKKAAYRFGVMLVLVLTPLNLLVVRSVGETLEWWAVAYVSLTFMLTWWAVQPHAPRNKHSAVESESYYSGPGWHMFGLSYASYLCVPRSVICAMPPAWQRRLTYLIRHLPAHLPEYRCQRVDENGKYVKDPLADYRNPDELWPEEPDIYLELVRTHELYSKNQEHKL